MNIREQFPIFKDKVYLSSCSMGALSTQVRQAYNDYLDDRDREGNNWGFWVGQLERTRQRIATLIHADSDEIAVVASVSHAVNGIASCIDFSSGRNKVVCTGFDFPTTAQIWHAQERRGAEVVHVACCTEGNTIPIEHFIEAIDERTAVVSIPHVSYTNGAKLDVDAIVKIARSKGALIVLDSYQAAGTLGIDVKSLDVDILLGGTQKYLLGSTGVGFMYVKADLTPTLAPITTGWFAQTDINAMDIYRNDPAPTARRFEAGTPNVPNLYAAIAGIDLILSIGVDKIEAHLTELNGMLKEGVLQRGFKLATHVDALHHGPMIAIKSTDMHQLVSKLADVDIIASCRDDNLRIAPHIYNNFEDIELLLNALSNNHALLA